MTGSTNCSLVSTDGIAKFCVSNGIPYSGSDTGSLRRYIKDFPDNDFIFVSGLSDSTIPNDFPEASSVIDNPKLKLWFSQNCVLGHPKLRQIPIGLDYHTLSEGRAEHWGPKATPIEQENELFNIKKKYPQFWERKKLGFCNFHFSNRRIQDRQQAWELPEKEALVFQDGWTPRKDTWNRMCEHAFVLSPHGVGLDCHRTWEALALGCIPIVKSSPLNPLFDDLPVWIVEEWSHVNGCKMDQFIERTKNQAFNYEKLTLGYWTNKITS